uniref:restriction endonuclease subunit S n=1 Tax=Bifidobacterium adolescentis TaxID=1680 RepID=UPI00359C1A31
MAEQHEKALVPQIRFTSFTDPWEQRKLGELTESYSGGTPAAGESEFYGGSIPFIRSAEIAAESTELFLTEKGYESSSARMVKPGDVLYALYGATSGEVAVSRQKGAINQAILAILPRDDCDARYITAWLRKQKGYIVTTYLQGGQGNLSGMIVKNLEVSIPSLPEQQKIGSMLSHLDSLITLHQRKYDKLCVLKKSMLDKMFPKGGSLYPEIRFAGFTDPWEQRKLGEVARRVTRKNENGDSDLPLTISAQYGLVDQRTFFNSQVASKDMNGYFLLHRGEFAYNKSTSTDSPWGAIKRLEKYDMGCVSTLYICFELLSGDPDFLVTYYETDRWYKSVQLIAAEGARNHGLLNIAPDDFFETQICIPKRIDEQRRIGAFFDRLDSLITLHQRKLELLRNIKKSMLDKMFV